MDQQGRLRPHRDCRERRFRRELACEKIRDAGSQEGGHGRLLLPLSSQHESDAQDRAVTAGSVFLTAAETGPARVAGAFSARLTASRKTYCLEMSTENSPLRMRPGKPSTNFATASSP